MTVSKASGCDFHPFAVLILFSVSPVYHVHLICMFFEAHICKLEEQKKFIQKNLSNVPDPTTS